jgi:hypothetical protein
MLPESATTMVQPGPFSKGKNLTPAAFTLGLDPWETAGNSTAKTTKFTKQN